MLETPSTPAGYPAGYHLPGTTLTPAEEHDRMKEYREYWLFKAKIAVLSERNKEALTYCVAAVERRRQCPNDMKDYKVFVRAIERRAQELRFRLHTVGALRHNRSIRTTETFANKAEAIERGILSELTEVCDTGLMIIGALLGPNGEFHSSHEHYYHEGQRALVALRGELLRYMQLPADAEKCYGEALSGERVNSRAFNRSHLGMSLLAPAERLYGSKIPALSTPIKPCEMPLLPIKLNMLEHMEHDAHLTLPFNDQEWQPKIPTPL